MATITKKYEGAFLVDESKLTRLNTVIHERLTKLNTAITSSYAVNLANQRVITTGQLQDVLALDNTDKNRINRLIATYAISGDTRVEVDFDGRVPTDIAISVSGEDTFWAHETISAVEEQVERSLQHGFMYGFTRTPVAGLFVMALILLSLLSLLTWASLQQQVTAEKMWLNSADLKEFQTSFGSKSVLTADDFSKIWTRQIRNVASESSSSNFGNLWNWQFVLVLLPLAIILGSFIYLLAKCYPPAVFVWGDVKDWYATLLQRRQQVWYVIIAGLVVGLVANMGVFGLAGIVHH